MKVIDLDVVDGRLTRALVRVGNHTPAAPVKEGLLLTTMEAMLEAFAAARD